jgi:hypothetical protein
MPLELCSFLKCYIEQIASKRSLAVFDWFAMACSLDADGLEMYDGFFTSLNTAYLAENRSLMSSSMQAGCKEFRSRRALDRSAERFARKDHGIRPSNQNPNNRVRWAEFARPTRRIAEIL